MEQKFLLGSVLEKNLHLILFFILSAKFDKKNNINCRLIKIKCIKNGKTGNKASGCHFFRKK